MLLGITGFVIIFVMVFLLLKEKAIPVSVFVFLPIAGALINGFSITEIADFVSKGCSTVWPMAALFVFTVTYFDLMADVGLFDKVVEKSVKIANGNVTGVLLAIFVIATVASLAADSPSTYLITMVPLLPLVRKLNIRVSSAMLVTCMAISVMNLLPWGGAVNRACITVGIDSAVMWKPLIPVQIFGWFCALIGVFIIGIGEKKRGAGRQAADDVVDTVNTAVSEEEAALKRPKLLWFNVLLTVLVFVLLFTTDLPNYFIFMCGCVLTLVVNYPNVQLQKERINVHAEDSLMSVATVLSAGVLVGVLNNSGMIVAMADMIIDFLPQALGPYLHLIFGFFGGFIGLGVNPDPLYYGLLPILIEVMANFGVSAESVAYALMIGGDSCFTLSPVIAGTYMALTVSGLSYKEHMRRSLISLWILGLLMLGFAMFIGIVTW